MSDPDFDKAVASTRSLLFEALEKHEQLRARFPAAVLEKARQTL